MSGPTSLQIALATCPDFGNIYALENSAIKNGYSRKQCITAFRKIYYDSAKPEKKYAGATIGGGAWNLLIPGASGTPFPPNWQKMNKEITQMKNRKVRTFGGKKVDLGHVFAGLDAANYPTKVSLAAGLVSMRSNQEAVTFIGDLGSVVVEYIKGYGKSVSFHSIAKERHKELEAYYDGAKGFISKEDMAGNADAYAISFNHKETLCQALVRYYTSSYASRYSVFAKKIGLEDGKQRKALQGEIFNAALAYAAATGHRSDVLLVLKDPGPGLLAPTFWEMYWNVSGWVLDIFVARIKALQ